MLASPLLWHTACGFSAVVHIPSAPRVTTSDVRVLAVNCVPSFDILLLTNLSPSFIPVIKLPPLSKTPVVNENLENLRKDVTTDVDYTGSVP
jgi:hypothetical protein